MLLRHFAIAWQFLTIIPLLKLTEVTPTDLARSMAFYPVVGLLLGGMLWVSWKGLEIVFPMPVVDIILIALLIVLTGGIHLDGLADTIDGLWGGKDREQALRIMRDEHIGSYGVIALIVALVAKYLALTQLPQGLKGHVLLSMPVLGRGAMVLVSYFSEYARNGPGLARPFLENLRWRETAWASLTVVLIVLLTLGVQGLVYLGMLGLVLFLSVWYFKKKIGGVTGDCIGAVGELVELAFLLSVLALSNLAYGAKS